MPAAIDVRDGRSDLIFSYQDAQGTYHDTQKIADVPEAYRKHVLVRDLSRKPEEVHADALLYVADLTVQDPDGGYPYAVVSRYRFRLPKMFVEPDGGIVEGGVVVYGTSWCGACAQARRFFTEHHIPFEDKDIEKDASAAEELAAKAKRAGFEPRGVPVIDVKGTLLEGFDPGAVQRALGGT